MLTYHKPAGGMDTCDACYRGQHGMPAAPVINHRILAVAGSGSGSGSGSAGPKPDDFDPKSPLTSYIDHRACGPRGDDAKADTSACFDGQAMVIKRQSIEEDADGRWEVIHTDVDGCEYFAYTIYECELKAEIRPADAAVAANPCETDPCLCMQDVKNQDGSEWKDQQDRTCEAYYAKDAEERCTWTGKGAAIEKGFALGWDEEKNEYIEPPPTTQCCACGGGTRTGTTAVEKSATKSPTEATKHENQASGTSWTRTVVIVAALFLGCKT